MNARKLLQIGSVVFALSVLTAYVVYSQLLETRRGTPNAKVTAISTGIELATTASKSNNVSDPAAVMLAPGSKSVVPIVAFWPDFRLPDAFRTDTQSLVFAPGSKSGQVFNLSHLPQAEEMVRGVSSANTARATNDAGSVK